MRTVIASASAQRVEKAGLLCLLTLLLLVAACGSDGGDPGAGEPTVVATTGVVADIARNVAGPDAEVAQLIPDGVDVHAFEVSAKDRQSLNDAALVVEAGAGLEAGLPLEQVEAPRWALTGAGENPLELESGEIDPHSWMSPAFVSSALPGLADALAAADPVNATRYRARATEYADKLDRLDTEISEELSQIPEERRSLVTSHDALGYFAARYGLMVIATPFPTSGPDAEPSAARLAEVQQAIERSGVPAVFAQTSDSTEVLDAVARETGVQVIDGLLVGSPGEAGSYVEMLRRNATLIAAALA